MNTLQSLIDASKGSDSAFAHPLQHTDIDLRTPAALAHTPDPRTSPTYTFLSSERVIHALELAGFVPVGAAQARTRSQTASRLLSARHVIRFRRRYETVTLRDCICEIIFLNAHDGRTATQFRLALYRPICTNGLIVCNDQLPVWRVPHRGQILDEVIAAALQLAEQFSHVAAWVERMQRTLLEPEQRLTFANDAIDLRFPKGRPEGLAPEHLLAACRDEDRGNDLWHTYNVIQEHVIKGGLAYRTATNRHMHSRGIRGIRADVHLNTELWKRATALAA